MRHVLYFLGLSLGAVALGCSSSTTDTTTITRPQLVAVSPDDFLNVMRVADASRVQSYVATLFDVTPGANGISPNPGFQLASSPATSPLLPVTFSFVITSHFYLAEVDAYTQALQADPADSNTRYIVPSSAGGRLQFDNKGARVTPGWVFTCGGYPTSPGDGGSFGGAAAVGEDFPAGAAGDDGSFPPGIIAYDGYTQTTNDCRIGLPPVTN